MSGWWFNKCCPSGLDCYVCTGAPEGDMILDLGAGGWVNEWCDKCDLVAGEYTLTGGQSGIPCTGSGMACCEWKYQVDHYCQVDVPIWGLYWLPLDIRLYILHQGGSPVNWRWGAQVEIGVMGVARSRAFWQAPLTSSTDCQSQFVGGKITMSKFFEKHEIYYAQGACSGAFADPLQAWAAP